MNLSSSLHFDNHHLQSLPIDKETKNFCRQVPNAIFSQVNPDPVKNPQVIAYSKSALELLYGKSVNVLSDEKENKRVAEGKAEGEAGEGIFLTESELAQYFSGNVLFPNSIPLAHCYCGHQFGSFAGQLGDGAAILLGDLLLPNDASPQSSRRLDLQLKGAGKTPYSRQADGRKVLRSSIREFLCSEAMHALHIPTTRAATCITSDSTVERDPFYDGNVIDEKCTIVSRIAENFFRFGSFEIFKTGEESAVSGEDDEEGGGGGRKGSSAGNNQLKELFLNYLLDNYFPEIAQKTFLTKEGKAQEYFQEIVHRTAKLMALWQAYGFVHGVMNTDNMSVMGVTIDYGPFGFMEYYDSDFVPNGSDHSGRYSYRKQPEIGKWNLMKFSQVLFPILSKEQAKVILANYDEIYQNEYLSLMRQKFGFLTNQLENDSKLFKDFFKVMSLTYGDFTDSFIAITEFIESIKSYDELISLLSQEETKDSGNALNQLIEKLTYRSATPSSIVNMMKRKLKIHRLHMNPGQIQQLFLLFMNNTDESLKLMFDPNVPIDIIKQEIFTEKDKLDILIKASEDIKKYEKMKAEEKNLIDFKLWKEFLLNSLLPRFLDDGEDAFQTSSNLQQRVAKMREINPTIVLRNWMAQRAIEEAEKKNNFNSTRELLKLLEDPFNPENSLYRLHPMRKNRDSTCPMKDSSKEITTKTEKEYFLSEPPEWADSLLCTCSS